MATSLVYILIVCSHFSDYSTTARDIGGFLVWLLLLSVKVNVKYRQKHGQTI